MTIETIQQKNFTMNEEMTPMDFTHLNKKTKDELRKRLEAILPTVDFLVAMHNAQDKAAHIAMTYIDHAKDGQVREHIVQFVTLSTVEINFPKEFEQFIHNYCTVLCAEKMYIEMLLTQ